MVNPVCFGKIRCIFAKLYCMSVADKDISTNQKTMVDIIRFFKFGLVGSVGILIDFSLTWLFRDRLKWNQYIANSIGFCVAASSNFVLNKIFTFQDQDHRIITQYLTFFMISCIGLIMNSLFLLMLQKKTNLNFYFSKILVTGLLFLWNYAANSIYTFNTTT